MVAFPELLEFIVVGLVLTAMSSDYSSCSFLKSQVFIQMIQKAKAHLIFDQPKKETSHHFWWSWNSYVQKYLSLSHQMKLTH